VSSIISRKSDDVNHVARQNNCYGANSIPYINGVLVSRSLGFGQNYLPWNVLLSMKNFFSPSKDYAPAAVNHNLLRRSDLPLTMTIRQRRFEPFYVCPATEASDY
jgi:hypothetical protein